MNGVTLCHDRKSPYSQIMEEVDLAIGTGMYSSRSFSCMLCMQLYKHLNIIIEYEIACTINPAAP